MLPSHFVDDAEAFSTPLAKPWIFDAPTQNDEEAFLALYGLSHIKAQRYTDPKYRKLHAALSHMATLAIADAETLVAEPRRRLLEALDAATDSDLDELAMGQGRIFELYVDALKLT